MTAYTIRVMMAEEASACRADLVDILVDSVETGASVNFIWPMTRAKAGAWWDGALASHVKGERLILVAEKDGRIDGTVQLVYAQPENQPFRAELAKMLVHSRARRQGLGSALMIAAEREAVRVGRTLLILDTEAASDGERLYERLGWIKFGVVPGYALSADGKRRELCSFFYKQLA